MKNRALSDRPLVCVVWDDAHGGDFNEYTADEIARNRHRAARIQTFGLLVQDDERGLTLAQEMTAEPAGEFTHFRGINFIPRGMVREVIALGVPKRPVRRRTQDHT